jgi:hypothetical protein
LISGSIGTDIFGTSAAALVLSHIYMDEDLSTYYYFGKCGMKKLVWYSNGAL